MAKAKTETVPAGELAVGDVLHLPGGYKSTITQRNERNLMPAGPKWIALHFLGSVINIIRFPHEPVVREAKES